MKLAEMDRLTDRLQLAAVADAAERLRHTLVQHPDLRLGFIFPDGASSATTELDLPPMVVQMFVDVLDLLAQGQAVSLSVKKLEMTTEETASFLGVSRSLIRQEIERGRLKFRKTGNRRMISRDEAVLYRDEKQRALKGE